MTCTEYLEGFSEYVDGRCTGAEASAFEEHRASCEPCARYTRVCAEGATLLQAFSSIRVDEDFESRLEHRIHGLRNELAIARTMGSGGSTAAVLSIAAILLVLAWSPLLFTREIQVELAPITVSRPGPRTFGIALPAVSIRPGSRSPAALGLDGDLWSASDALFREYSPVQKRYRDGRSARSGVQQ